MAHQSPKPYAMLFCDQILRDDMGKRSLIGLFDRVEGEDYPLVLPRMAVFFALDAVQTTAGLTLRMTSETTGEQVADSSLPEIPQDRLPGKVELALAFQGVPFKLPGNYRFELLQDGRSLIGRTIEAVALPPHAPRSTEGPTP
jgi:hypothetical protein